jgi:xylulokinase
VAKCIASYDFGTSGVKIVMVDLTGNIIITKEKSYALLRPAPGWVEQDPKEYWDAVCIVTRAALAETGMSPSDILGLSFTTQEYNIIPIDAKGKILYNALSWLDSRAGKEAEEINKKLGAQVVRAQEPYCRLMWLKNNRPEVYKSAKVFLGCNQYLLFKATGVMEPKPDDPGIFHYTPEVDAFLQRIYDAAGLDRSRLPPHFEACAFFAGLDKKGASELGLNEGTPVFGGSVDVTGAAAGAGCIKEGDAHVYFGSSGWLSVIVKGRVTTADGGYNVRSIIPGYYIYGGCTNSVCMTLNWAINTFYKAEKERLGKDIYDLVNNEAGEIPPGSENLLAGPWLDGEQFPINDLYARGVFFNMNQRHTRGHFINAIYEGVCYNLKGQVELYKQDTGKTLSRLGANGGGSNSDHWMQVTADVLQKEIYVPKDARHSGAIGAVLAAAVGLKYCSPDDISAFVKIKKEFSPRKEYAALYEDKYDKFMRLYSASKNLFAELNEVSAP